ncbi:MAG: hypothetical protein ACI86X_001794 [Moritella sp.]|jgi:hypothetical protein
MQYSANETRIIEVVRIYNHSKLHLEPRLE